MNILSVVAIAAISTMSFGATLLEDAKNAGLKAIPHSKL